jgi:hypothetical protein
VGLNAQISTSLEGPYEAAARSQPWFKSEAWLRRLYLADAQLRPALAAPLSVAGKSTCKGSAVLRGGLEVVVAATIDFANMFADQR